MALVAKGNSEGAARAQVQVLYHDCAFKGGRCSAGEEKILFEPAHVSAYVVFLSHRRRHKAWATAGSSTAATYRHNCKN
eukprot:scaffold92168_cov14-Tisochrysis_lutea.AAC.1